MREFANKFYSSYTWKKTREEYMRKVGGLCERCLKKGVYSPAEIVHHKIYLTPDNIQNLDVSLSFENLEAVCRECHADEHMDLKRYKVDELGNVKIKREI